MNKEQNGGEKERGEEEEQREYTKEYMREYMKESIRKSKSYVYESMLERKVEKEKSAIQNREKRSDERSRATVDANADWVRVWARRKILLAIIYSNNTARLSYVGDTTNVLRVERESNEHWPKVGERERERERKKEYRKREGAKSVRRWIFLSKKVYIFWERVHERGK